MDLDPDTVDLMQRGQQKRKRSLTPRRRRHKSQGKDGRDGRGHREETCDDDRGKGKGQPPAAGRGFRHGQPEDRRQLQDRDRQLGPPREPKAPPATPRRSEGRQPGRTKFVSIVPTLEQLGPGVRMWSDAVGVTGEAENFTGQGLGEHDPCTARQRLLRLDKIFGGALCRPDEGNGEG